MTTNNVDKHEPAPIENELPPIINSVCRLGIHYGVKIDLRARAETGKLKYGVLLQPFNGRNAVMDAYQECLDMIMYLAQAHFEMLELEPQAANMGVIEKHNKDADIIYKMLFKEIEHADTLRKLLGGE